MSSDAKLPKEQLFRALQQESLRFEESYLWLEASMPNIFFREVPADWITLIVHSLVGFKEQDFFSSIHLKGASIVLCLDSPEADLEILKHYPMYGIKNYTTYISRTPFSLAGASIPLRLATLHFTDAIEPLEMTFEQEQCHSLLQALKMRHSSWAEEYCASLLHTMDPRFLRKLSHEHQVMCLELLERAQREDQCQFEVEYEENWSEKGVPSVSLTLAWKNVPKHNFLYRLAQVVYQHGLIMQRVNATYLRPYEVDSIFLLSFSLHGRNGKAAWEESDLSDFLQELVTLKYFSSTDDIDAIFVRTHLLTGNQGNLIRSLIPFVHQVLVHVDPNLYSLDNIREGLIRHPELTIKLCEAFCYRFHPTRHNLEKFQQLHAESLQLISQIDTGHESLDTRRKNILTQSLNFIAHILKTNFYCNNKTALAFRLDPHYLENVPFDRKTLFPELPYGIFFFKGMHFIGFHIRFRDLSRGGLRTIFPERKEQVLAEQNTIFSECYQLAYTQHQKNKDIPEGGAKGVIFLKPYEYLASEVAILSRELHAQGFSSDEIQRRIVTFQVEQKLSYLYQTQRAYISSFLSLINHDLHGNLRTSNIIDYWSQPEFIYLGPDENLHDRMIEWIAQESTKELYKPKGAFISGKPTIGINHKEHGVTSLGVHVYMEEILRYIGIDPHTQPFSIKMTGGPDGDVAGNQICNLHRFYPNTAKLIALTDISGTIYDPEGLDLSTCVQLFHEAKSIRHYPPEKLHNGGFLLDRETRKELNAYTQQTRIWRYLEGRLLKEWLSGNETNYLFGHNVHQTKATLFLPCGGRPRTLNESNYRDFFDKIGNPTATAIVEGANLYFSSWARHYLEKQGILIIKDSSANKGGVICSSFEILCGLALSDEEFLQHKPQIVQEILTRLQQCARAEAHLLLSTHQVTKKPLTDLSDQISARINLFNDQLLAYLNTIELPDDPHDPLIQCYLSYCLPLLRSKFQERLLRDIPANHKKAIISCHLSSQLVYKRGLDWWPTLVDILPLVLHQHLIDHHS